MAIKSPPGLIPLSYLSGEELLAHPRFNRVTDERGHYLPFDELQYRIKKGKNVDVVWMLTHLMRSTAIQRINYCSEAGEQVGSSITSVIAEACELVDKRATTLTLKDQTERSRGAGAKLNQLHLEESITSSQLEDTNTTTLVVRGMLETGRSPCTEGEYMAVGNARLMTKIPYLLTEPLTLALTHQLYAISMSGINDTKYRPGGFRETDDVVIADYNSDITHQPSAAALLPERLEKVCQWLNSYEGYTRPLVRACTLHFMLAHEYPFRDGNRHTSRALFYWYMLKSGHDVSKYVSTSSLLHAVPVKYTVGYQRTKSDGMDPTYSPEYQVGVIKRALRNWQQHIDEITQRSAKLDSVLPNSGVFRRPNPRQVTLLNMMLANPGKEYTTVEISVSLNASDNTTQIDLRTTVKEGLTQEKGINNQQAMYVMYHPPQLLPVDS